MASPYRINLPVYEGPLDLLLDLIRKQEMDIHNIPIAKVTEQYLDYLHQLEKLDVNVSADFIYMAASLIHIKSKMLLPPDPLAYRRSFTLTSGDTDASVILLPLQGPGLPPPDPSVVTRSTDSGPRVHVGFLLAWDSIAQTVLDKLEPQLQAYPSYNIVVCGKVKFLLLSSW